MKYYRLTFRAFRDGPEVFYVKEATWNWINSPRPKFTSFNATEEMLPPEVIAEGGHIKKDDSSCGKVNCVQVTIGSCENDRALAAAYGWARKRKPKNAEVMDGGEWWIY
jgi:hypothetical protein